MNLISVELCKIPIIPDKIEEIRQKDGIGLYRIFSGSQSFVLKYFYHEAHTREIIYYDLLTSSGVPTLEIIAKSDRMILMEDLLVCKKWRLGTIDDLNDPKMASNLAQWYRMLHDTSDLILSGTNHWYAEYNLLTRENLQLAARKTMTESAAFWQYVDEYLDALHQIIGSLKPVVNYNDFYYTNLAVARDGRSAKMFDYNCMGKGYAASDVRNVCWSLSDRAAQAFRESYGTVSEFEYRVDDVVSVLTTLVMAAQRPEMPSWADFAVCTLKSGKLQSDMFDLISS